MQAISPKLGELLVKTTRSRDIDDAFRRVFSEYLALKTASLSEVIKGFNEKWGMDFNEFKKTSNLIGLRKMPMLLTLNGISGNGRKLKL